MIFWQKITDIKTQELKGNLQWERRGAGKVANVRKRSRTVAITVCLSFNLDVVYNFNVFPFPLSKAQSLGDVPMNRQNAANCSHPFWIIFVFCVLMQRCTLHHKAMQYNFAASIICKFYFADFFPHPRASPNNAGWFGGSIGNEHYKGEKKT